MKTALDQDLARLSVAAYEEVRDTQDTGKETTTEDTVQPMAQGTDTDTSDTPAADSVWFQPWEGCEQDYHACLKLCSQADPGQHVRGDAQAPGNKENLLWF